MRLCCFTFSLLAWRDIGFGVVIFSNPAVVPSLLGRVSAESRALALQLSAIAQDGGSFVPRQIANSVGQTLRELFQ